MRKDHVAIMNNLRMNIASRSEPLAKNLASLFCTWQISKANFNADKERSVVIVEQEIFE